MTDDYVAEALALLDRFMNKPVNMFQENAEDVVDAFRAPFENEYGKELSNRVFENTPEFLRFEIEKDAIIIGRNCVEKISRTNFTRALSLALDAHEDDIIGSSITVLILHNASEPELPYIEIIV